MHRLIQNVFGERENQSEISGRKVVRKREKSLQKKKTTHKIIPTNRILLLFEFLSKLISNR